MRSKRKDRKNIQDQEQLFKNEERLANASKEILELISHLSNFDVEMKHVSNNSMRIVEKMEELSSSNLSIVEETTATMHETTDTIDSTVEKFKVLTDVSKNLFEQNEKSKDLLVDVSNLKQQVLSDTKVMGTKMEELVKLTAGIENFVNSVQSIAKQTNLLALNAAIEASKAGEAGKGFAVVADEIRKLSDDTKMNLEGMTSFVAQIFEAVNDGKESMGRAITSTNDMSEMIDAVSNTISENILELNEVTEGIQNISSNMDGIKSSSNDINLAMESSAQDAQELLYITKSVSNDANKTLGLAKSIEEIDDGLSDVTKNMYEGLLSGQHAVSNDELLDVIKKAKGAHVNWLKKLKKMVDDMQILSLQTNSKKCAFGHYYHVFQIKHPAIASDWSRIDSLHHEFHSMGDKIIATIQKEDVNATHQFYDKAEQLSKQLLGILQKIEDKVSECSQNGINIFS